MDIFEWTDDYWRRSYKGVVNNYQKYLNNNWKEDDIRWVKKGILARSSRPGYPSEKVSRKDVDSFIKRANIMGIKSIICFLRPIEYKGYYKSIGNLSEYYYQNGFRVVNIPVTDFKSPALSGGELERALMAFDNLPKPVLVHCSAGMDRTGLFVKMFQRFLQECVSIYE